VLVAVYGTLKQGEANYERYLSGREPVHRGAVRAPYLMYDNGSYPMLVPVEEEHAIFVEIYDVDDRTLRALDALEEPYDYRRETIHVSELGRDVEIYVHTEPPPPGFRLAVSGDWKSQRGFP
jgi:gamma-glutamylcyclotransferase (GGCT)/AIG2-like uncharacterized protein YtfP